MLFQCLILGNIRQAIDNQLMLKGKRNKMIIIAHLTAVGESIKLDAKDIESSDFFLTKLESSELFPSDEN